MTALLDHSKITWVGRYLVDSLQIYFPASLELQEELIGYGFQVPISPDGRVKTPIPLIYSNFRGWVREPEPVTIERLIPSEWFGVDSRSLGWVETRFKGKRAFRLPVEKVYVDIGYDDLYNVYLKLDIIGYHLERVSIRMVNPEKWNNWAMFYISSEYFDDLLNLLGGLVRAPLLRTPMKVKREDLQGGKEITYYAYTSGKEDVGVPIEGFSLCLGCFPLAFKYFKIKAEENSLPSQIVDQVRFRLEYVEYDREINTGLKVGVAKVLGKNPQIMFKLASNTSKSIRGILKDRIEGKARGKLVYCNHRSKAQYIIVKGELLYAALNVTRKYLAKLPSEKEHIEMLS